MPYKGLVGPYVCFACRKSFKRSRGLESAPCSDCGLPMIELNQKFQAPPKRDKAAWEVVEFLVDHGFRFDSMYERNERGVSERVFGRYPRTMDEAREFVLHYRPPRGRRKKKGEG